MCGFGSLNLEIQMQARFGFGLRVCRVVWRLRISPKTLNPGISEFRGFGGSWDSHISGAVRVFWGFRL